MKAHIMSEQDIRWKQRFENPQSAYKKLRHAAQVNANRPDDDLIQMALIKAFEMTLLLKEAPQALTTARSLPPVAESAEPTGGEA